MPRGRAPWRGSYHPRGERAARKDGIRHAFALLLHPMNPSDNRFVSNPLGWAAAGLLATLSTAAPGQDEAAPTEAEAALAEPDVVWSGSASLGLHGASGNTERLNVRGDLALSRDTARFETDFSAVYSYATEEGTESANRFDTKLRNDWLIADSPWRYYARARYEFDEFQDWRHRVSGGPGVGYLWSKTESLYFLTRAGMDLTREFDGVDNTITPEAVLGLDLQYNLSESQRLVWVFDFMPDVSEFGPYRFETNAALELDIDRSNGLFLRVGVEDRYDSTPGPEKKRNDFVYFITLGWKM